MSKAEYQSAAEGTWHKMSFEELRSGLNVSFPDSNVVKGPGLSEGEAKTRNEKYGLNQLSPPKRTPSWLRFLKQFTDPLLILLAIAMIFSYILYGIDTSDPTNLYLAVALNAVILIQGVISFIQENKAMSLMDSISNLGADKAVVVRDGRKRQLSAENITIGDIVVLESGDKIPADVRLISVDGLKMDNSSLTGESEAIEACVEGTDEYYLESRNMAYNGSFITEGSGIGLAVALGDKTVIGDIARLASSTGNQKTTLEREVEYFVKFIAVLSTIMSIIVFSVGLARGVSFQDAFVNGIIVTLVANVPQGLPATVQSTLTIATGILSEQNVLVKRPNVIETLGATTTIASDKTGTLTQNKMTVEHVFTSGNVHTAKSLIRDTTHADIMDKGEMKDLVACAAVCNMAEIQATEEDVVIPVDQRKATDMDDGVSGKISRAVSRRMETSHRGSMTSRGSLSRIPGTKSGEKHDDPSEMHVNFQRSNSRRPSRGTSLSKMASYRAAEKLREQEQGLKPQGKVTGNASDIAIYNFVDNVREVTDIRNDYSEIYTLPFNSKNKFMIKIVEHVESGDRTIFLKGAPERILARCEWVAQFGRKEELTDQWKSENLFPAMKNLAKMGERILGFACFHLEKGAQLPSKFQFSNDDDADCNFPVRGFTFLGLMAMIDPPKEGVPEAVASCKSAEIRVMMVTGDHPDTAVAIARKCNIIRDFATRDEIAEERSCNPDEVPEEDVGAAVVTGQEVNDFTEDDWKRVLIKPEIVFARTSPQNKLAIVTALQEFGEIVAVTGDGVNDSPALKKADIGCAMGIGGSEVAKDASDVVLMDDNFASIVLGVTTGRRVFDNLVKTIAYTLTHLWPEVFPAVMLLLIGLPLGLNSLLVLIVDLGTELGPAISFAYELPEANVMDRPPRNAATDRLVNKQLLSYAYLQAGIIELGFCLAAYFWVMSDNNVPTSVLFHSDFFVDDAPDLTLTNGEIADSDAQADILSKAQTAWFVTLVLSQLAHCFQMKTRVQSIFVHGIFNNVTMLYGVLVSAGIMFFVVYVPFGNQIFNTAEQETPGTTYTFWLGSAGLLLIWNEFRKFEFRKLPEGHWFRRWFQF
eukprot:Clim_evm96s225 gene=Clim_evmTU96s225